MSESPIYLDNNATTPVDPRVLEAMLPYLREQFGNAASRHHALGRRAAEAVERARNQVAAAIGADAREIVFTSGATESDNTAIKGVATWPSTAARGRHLITARTEHMAVIDSARALEAEGWEVSWLPVDAEGGVELDELAAAIRDDTTLVSIMHANNETGVVHPVGAIAALCRDRGVVFHTDATQAIGREPVNVEDAGIGLLSLSAHKIYGPKGVGALYVRRRPRVRCRPLIDGGGHERGLRSGTLNVAGIVALGEAAEIAVAELAGERARLESLRDALEARLRDGFPSLRVNGAGRPRLANTLNASFVGIDAEALMHLLPDVAISSASACTTAVRQPSYVLGTMGRSDAEIRGAVRISLGRFTGAEDIERAARRILEAAAELQAKEKGS